MPIVSRFMLFSSKHRSTRYALPLLPRCIPSNRTQSVRYTKSTKGKSDIHPLSGLESGSQPSPRSWPTYAAGAAALGFAGLAAFFHYNDERRAVPKGQQGRYDRCGNVVNGPIIGGPFTLINTDKQTVTERNFLGNWVLLYFGYTSSPDLGPEQVQVMAKAIDILESKQSLKILPVFVTIDPQRDTPSQLHAYLKEFDSRIVGLTGPVAAVRQMAQEYRVYFKKVEEDGGDYLVDCSHNMYLLNPNMEVVRCFGVEYNAEDLSEAIRKELNRSPS